MNPQMVTSPHDAARRAELEPLPWALYDTVLVGTSQSAELTFFQTPLSSTKGRQSTNLGQGGSLQAPNVFLVQSFSVHLLPQFTFTLTDITDAQIVLWSAVVSLVLGSQDDKHYVRHPAAFFPSGRGLTGAMTTGGATSANVAFAVNNGVPALNNRWSFGKRAFSVTPNEGFHGGAEFPGGALSLTASLSMMQIMDGMIGRAVR